MQPTVLLLGATGRTGGRVLQQLLSRGVRVRAIVRDRHRLPGETAASPDLTVVEASLLSLGDDPLRDHLRGCDAVISCLGHVLNVRGIFGPPRDLVTAATTRVCRALERLEGPNPVKFVLMSSVSVHRSRALDPRRGSFERAFLAVLRGLVPPAADNQRAADFLGEAIGPDHAAVRWVVVRPDTLLDGERTPYTLHEGLVHGLFRPGTTRMANVAHFMGELVTDEQTWATWASKLPVIVDARAV